MNIHLKIHAEEMGRFLAAYYRGVFGRNIALGKAFLIYYGLVGYKDLAAEIDNRKALDTIRNEFLGRLD